MLKKANDVFLAAVIQEELMIDRDTLPWMNIFQDLIFLQFQLQETSAGNYCTRTNQAKGKGELVIEWGTKGIWSLWRLEVNNGKAEQSKYW